MPQPLSVVGGVEEILGAVQSYQARDDEIEVQVKQLGSIAGRWWGGLVGSVILVVILAMVGGSASSLIALPVLVGVVCLVMGIVFSTRQSGWQKQDMEDRRLELAQQLFNVLGRDIPRRSKCALTVSFDDYRQHGKLLEQSKSGFFGSVKHYKYEDIWFSARGSLYDGNRFKITVTQTIRRKEKAKRKYTKVNERVNEEVTLLLKISSQTYPDCAGLAATLKPGVNEGLQVTRIQVQGGLLRVTCETPMAQRMWGRSGSSANDWDCLATGDTLLRLFVLVYAQLQNCRAPETAA